jgi:hypothetical protein
MIIFVFAAVIAIKQYRENLAQYQQLLMVDDVRMDVEKQNKQEIEQQQELIKQRYQNTRDVLKTLYDLNVVYKDYRGLVPISMFCQYLDSGRCTQLEGYEGAYNLYEKEKQLGIIIINQYEIINKLDRIEKNQAVLYGALQKSNQMVSKILDEVQNTSKFSELSAYNSWVAAENAEAMNRQMAWQNICVGSYMINHP